MYQFLQFDYLSLSLDQYFSSIAKSCSECEPDYRHCNSIVIVVIATKWHSFATALRVISGSSSS